MEGDGGNTKIISGTLIWTIKYFSRLFELRDGAMQTRFQNELISPIFSLDPLEHFWWDLRIRSHDGSSQICYSISLLSGFAVEEGVEVDFELSFLAADGSALIAKRTRKSFLRLDEFTFKSFACKDEVLVTRRKEFLPNNTLTVRVRIFDNRSNQSGNTVVPLGRTEILREDGSSVLNVERFSSLKVGQKHEFNVSPNIHAFSPMIVSINFADNGDDVQIDVADSDKSEKRSITVTFEISAINAIGNIIGSSTGNMYIRDGLISEFPEFLSKSELMANQLLYLPNDTLTLRCSYTIHHVDETEYSSSIPISLKTNGNVSSELNRRTEQNIYKVSLSLAKDLTEVYEKGTLSDLNIRVGSETFPAHKLILSARSPVFMTMFTTDMKEKDAKCIDMSDLVADTVRRMLKYIYADVVEDLQWDSATRLYFAADKYQLLLLKDTCSAFLKANLSTLSVCEALVLADMHQDDDLKSEIQDFILRHDKEIMNSMEWRHLKASHKQLAFETMEFFYLKKL